MPLAPLMPCSPSRALLCIVIPWLSDLHLRPSSSCALQLGKTISSFLSFGVASDPSSCLDACLVYLYFSIALLWLALLLLLIGLYTQLWLHPSEGIDYLLKSPKKINFLLALLLAFWYGRNTTLLSNWDRNDLFFVSERRTFLSLQDEVVRLILSSQIWRDEHVPSL